MIHQDADGTNEGGMSATGEWVAVALVVLILLIVPGIILMVSPGRLGSFGLYVVIAMIPALAFGAFGVWTALRHRHSDASN
ncbi:MAG: hypothetical protein ACOCY7_04910 [Halodesulfurarchaeum sp.]